MVNKTLKTSKRRPDTKGDFGEGYSPPDSRTWAWSLDQDLGNIRAEPDELWRERLSVLPMILPVFDGA